MIKRNVICILLIFLSSFVFARPRDIEIAHGEVKLVVDQRTGCFFVYYLKDRELEKYIPLFSDRKRGTSFLKLKVDDKEFNINKADFTVTCAVLSEADDTVVITYTSDSVVVEQRISFLYEVVIGNAYGIKSEWVITNALGKTVNLAAKYLLDTSFGESRVPFYTNEIAAINGERQLVWPYNDLFVVAPEQNYSMMLMLQGQGIEIPNKVVFGNWQRLFNSSWDYEAVPLRNFSLLPYSVDDAAVCLYWPSAYLAPKASTTVNVAIGRYKDGGLVAQQKEKTEPMPVVVAPVLVPESSVSQLPTEIETDTRKVQILEIIDRIDYLMLHPEEAAGQELLNLEERLKILSIEE